MPAEKVGETVGEKRTRAAKASHSAEANAKRKKGFEQAIKLRRDVKAQAKELQKQKVERFGLRVFDGKRVDAGRAAPTASSAG